MVGGQLRQRVMNVEDHVSVDVEGRHIGLGEFDGRTGFAASNAVETRVHYDAV